MNDVDRWGGTLHGKLGSRTCVFSEEHGLTHSPDVCACVFSRARARGVCKSSVCARLVCFFVPLFV
jgi:hypothetical protein